MRRLLVAVLAAAVALPLAAAAPASGGAAPPCGPGETEIGGVVRDQATGLRLTETTSVGVQSTTTTYADGLGTVLPSSRWSGCVPSNDTYTISFFADNYRLEDYDDQPVGSGTPVAVGTTAITNLHASLLRKGKVLHGRVTNQAGRPLFASIGIWRQMPGGAWRSIDGEGNDLPSGRWSYRVPGPGRYRVSFAADHHWGEWHDNVTRLRHARVIVVTASTTSVTGIDGDLRFCTTADRQCFPFGFNS